MWAAWPETIIVSQQNYKTLSSPQQTGVTQGVTTEQEAGNLVTVELERVLAHSTLQDVGLLGWRGRGLSLSDRQPRPL